MSASDEQYMGECDIPARFTVAKCLQSQQIHQYITSLANDKTGARGKMPRFMRLDQDEYRIKMRTEFRNSVVQIFYDRLHPKGRYNYY